MPKWAMPAACSAATGGRELAAELDHERAWLRLGRERLPRPRVHQRLAGARGRAVAQHDDVRVREHQRALVDGLARVARRLDDDPLAVERPRQVQLAAMAVEAIAEHVDPRRRPARIGVGEQRIAVGEHERVAHEAAHEHEAEEAGPHERAEPALAVRLVRLPVRLEREVERDVLAAHGVGPLQPVVGEHPPRLVVVGRGGDRVEQAALDVGQLRHRLDHLMGQRSGRQRRELALRLGRGEPLRRVVRGHRGEQRPQLAVGG